MLGTFFQKKLSTRIVFGSIVAVTLSLLFFYGTNLLCPFVTGFSSADILQIMQNTPHNDGERVGILYILSTTTISTFFIPAIILLSAIYRKPNQILFCQTLTTNSTKIVLAVSTILVIFANIAGLNLLSEINTNSILSIVGEESTLWKNYQTIEQFTQNVISPNLFWINILCLSIIPAVCEEVFFRGFLQKIAYDVLKNKHIAIIFIAAIFSITHNDLFNFIPRLLLGILLGYLFDYAQNLWFPILAHATHNALVVNSINSEQISAEVETIGTTQNMPLLGVCSLLIFAGFITILIKQSLKN